MRCRFTLLLLLLSSFIGVSACQGFASQSRVQSIEKMNEGIELSTKGNNANAEKALQEAVNLDRSHAAAHANLGRVYLKQGKWVDAENAFKNAIENMGNEPEAKYYYELGVVQAAQGETPTLSLELQESKYRAAIDSLQQAIKLNPRLFKAFFRVGTLHEKLDEPEKADSAYRKAIELDPHYSAAFVRLGNMYIDYGFADIAMKVLESGAKLNEKDAQMWNGIGRAHLAIYQSQPKENEHLVKAVDAFSKAKSIDPNMADVLFGLGMAYNEMRERQKAIDSLNAFLAKADSTTPSDRIKAARDTIARLDAP